MKNEYEVRGDIVAIFLKRKNGDVLEAIVEASDLELAMTIKGAWYAREDARSKKFYVYHGNRAKNIAIALHRLITNAPKGLQVDHINHNTLDNRKTNLRVVTQVENRQNLSGAFSSNRSSGYRNIHWHKEEKKWQVTVGANKKRHYIGKFTKLEDAQIAAIEARKKYQIS